MKFLFDEINNNKDSIYRSVSKTATSLTNDIIIQEERIYELGETVFTQGYTLKKRFEDIKRQDTQLQMHAIQIE